MVRGLAVVALVCIAAAIAVGIAKPWSGGAASGLTASSSLRLGGFLVVVHNDSGCETDAQSLQAAPRDEVEA